MVLAFPPADEGYIAYIDESGDPGIKDNSLLGKGPSSEWFSLGALVVKSTRESEVVSWVQEIRNKSRILQRPDIHFADMKRWQREFACSYIAEQPVRCFAVVSNKKNMIGYRNIKAEAARGGSANETFYNFCARVLLERVTDFVLDNSIRQFERPKHVRIVFSERGGVRCSQSSAYMDLLINQARSKTTVLNAREIKWQVVHPRLIHAEPHNKSAGCQLADVVASSFRYAADTNGIRDHTISYAKALENRMWAKQGVIAYHGVTLLPWRKEDRRNITSQQSEIFRHYGYGF
jgi:Protein of unknown function (DUF3800)